MSSGFRRERDGLELETTQLCNPMQSFEPSRQRLYRRNKSDTSVSIMQLREIM